MKPKTDEAGIARVELPSKYDEVTNPHLSYRFVVRFNMDRRQPEYKPFQTPQFEFYALARMPPKLEPLE